MKKSMTKEKNITVIGIGDQQPVFSEEIKALIQSSRFFSGGKRHYQWVKDFLPEDAHWIEITVPLNHMIQLIKEQDQDWVVFASGDPLFFGIANTLRREIPNAQLKVLPSFNTIQLLGHRLGVNYGEYKMVTLTGRPWAEFDKALVQRESKIAVLTDRKKTPSAIAKRMMDAGMNDYKVEVGECLGGASEQIFSMSVEEVCRQEFNAPNCMLLRKVESTPAQKGIVEGEFKTLEGRPNMITKMPVRMATLSFMQLHNKNVFWDVGACSGSVSIEAKLNYPHLEVIPFEIRAECEEIINENKRKFKVPGLKPQIGDFSTLEKRDFPKPDAVFLGGYGGKMHAILDEVNSYLHENGILAFNSVSKDSAQTFKEWIQLRNFKCLTECSVSVDAYNPIQIIVAQKQEEL